MTSRRHPTLLVHAGREDMLEEKRIQWGSVPSLDETGNRVSSAKGVHLAGIFPSSDKKQKGAQDVCKVSRDTRYEIKTRVGVGTNS